MITNLPTAEGLHETALKLHFRAWNEVLSIVSAFDGSYPTSLTTSTDDDDEWAEERAYYLDSAQEELQAVLAIVQQSNELALKARIAAVSPYLLIVNTDIPFSASGKDVDFSNLRTLDAVDLPRAVNTICPERLSQRYIQRYGELRLQRNQYTHLGRTSAYLKPLTMLTDLIDQYLELWPNGMWLKDRLMCEYAGRGAFFDDKNWSPRLSVMSGLDDDWQVIDNLRFKRLFGVSKSQIKFCCHKCRDDWAISRWDPGPRNSRTAYFEKATKKIRCLMCDTRFEISGDKCCMPNCKSPFVALANENDAGMCFVCANEPVEIEEDLDLASPLIEI